MSDACDIGGHFSADDWSVTPASVRTLVRDRQTTVAQLATIVVSASRSRRIATSGDHGEDLAILAEPMAQTKTITRGGGSP